MANAEASSTKRRASEARRIMQQNLRIYQRLQASGRGSEETARGGRGEWWGRKGGPGEWWGSKGAARGGGIYQRLQASGRRRAARAEPCKGRTAGAWCAATLLPACRHPLTAACSLAC